MKKVSGYLKNNSVFVAAVICSLAVILYGAFNSVGLNALSGSLLEFLNNNFAWFYLLALPAFFVFLIYIACSKYGKIKLGGQDEKPEYSTLSWFAMLFCAGTGIGLVFWSIAEPLTHYTNPPYGIEAGSEQAANFSIRTSFLHWGLLPWACFAIVGLALAYFQFNKKKKALISSSLIPLIGEKRAGGTLGRLVDFFSVLVTVAGVATSLGIGCMQICGGLNHLFSIPNTKTTWFIVIVVITCVFACSAISGIGRGIKLISNINSWLAIALLIMAFCVGPANTILKTLVNGLGEHITYFFSDCLKISPYGDSSWELNWRVFYWAWWVAWAPFVGMFIARISKGRTVREFIIAVMVVPSALTFVWYSVFGTLAISAGGNWSLAELAKIAASPETAVFIVFETYPLGKLLSGLVVILLILFFITSADSATFSLGMLSHNGSLNPPAWKKICWSALVAFMAFVLLCSGGLKPLQTVSIVAALPFLVIMIIMCFSIVKAFKENNRKEDKK